MVLRVIAVAFLLSFSGVGGCIFPVNTPEPYGESKLAGIRTGESSRDRVASILGQPDAQLDSGNYWVYGETQMVIYDMAGPGIHDYQSLLVTFENDVVESFEALESKYGCWSAGLCLVSGWIDYPTKDRPAKLHRQKTAVVSQRADDSKAKNFAPGKEKCGVYFYKKDNAVLGIDYSPAVSLGSVNDEPLHYKGYIFQIVPSGIHTFTAEDQSVEFACKGDALIYFEVEHDVGWLQSETFIHRVNEEEGKEAVARRNLLLTW